MTALLIILYALATAVFGLLLIGFSLGFRAGYRARRMVD